MFVLALILILLGIAGLFVSLVLHKKVKNMMSAESSRYFNSDLADAKFAKKTTLVISCILGAVGPVVLFFSSFYVQDAGEAKVQVSWTGELIGQTTEEGLHFKAPWVSVRTFDVRNNIASFIDGGGDHLYGRQGHRPSDHLPGP